MPRGFAFSSPLCRSTGKNSWPVNTDNGRNSGQGFGGYFVQVRILNHTLFIYLQDSARLLKMLKHSLVSPNWAVDLLGAIGGGALPRLVLSSRLDLLTLQFDSRNGTKNGPRARRGKGTSI